MGWHEHDEAVFHGCEKFFRPGYAANLVCSWIPALSDVKQKLEAGARVADVGCGKGASTILMAKAFPKSRFFGFDYHDKSIEAAREIAKRERIADRVTFEVAKAKEYPGKGLRSRRGLRLPARHGRSRRRRRPRSSIAASGRDLDDRRAIRQRRAEGQSESRRPGLLLVLDPAVYTLFPIAGSRTMFGRAIRRSPHPGSRHQGGVRSFPACHRDTFQHRLRSTPLS